MNLIRIPTRNERYSALNLTLNIAVKACLLISNEHKGV